MNTCVLDLFVPSRSKLIPFREINTHQQKLISKASMISDNIYCTEFLLELLNTIKYNTEIDDLNIHDMLVILLGLKASSIDIKIPLNVVCDKCGQKHKYEVRLDKMYGDLCKINPQSIPVTIGNYKLEIAVPNVLKEMSILYELKRIAFTDDKEAVEKSFILNIDRYIKKITHKTGEILQLPTLDDKLEFYKKMSMEDITQLLTDIQKVQITYKLFDFTCVEPCNKQLYRVVNYDIDKFYFILKLIYNESIIDILKDTFYLQKIGIPIDYSENITHQERRLLWGFFNELEQKKSAASRNSTPYGPLGT